MANAKKVAKKEFRSKIVEKLTVTFSDLEKDISPKEFNKKILKASKVLTKGIKAA
jgi:hypothetical protein